VLYRQANLWAVSANTGADNQRPLGFYAAVRHKKLNRGRKALPNADGVPEPVLSFALLTSDAVFETMPGIGLASIMEVDRES
jgi:hypothetical protein